MKRKIIDYLKNIIKKICVNILIIYSSKIIKG